MPVVGLLRKRCGIALQLVWACLAASGEQLGNEVLLTQHEVLLCKMKCLRHEVLLRNIFNSLQNIGYLSTPVKLRVRGSEYQINLEIAMGNSALKK